MYGSDQWVRRTGESWPISNAHTAIVLLIRISTVDIVAWCYSCSVHYSCLHVNELSSPLQKECTQTYSHAHTDTQTHTHTHTHTYTHTQRDTHTHTHSETHILTRTHTHTQTHTHTCYPIRHRFTCRSSNIIYLITCKKQYIGKTISQLNQ